MSMKCELTKLINQKAKKNAKSLNPMICDQMSEMSSNFRSSLNGKKKRKKVA